MPYSDPDKRREYEKQWRERNREKSREATRKSYFKHHEKNLARARQKNAAGKQYAHDWHQANKERRMVRVKERYQTIPEVRARRNAEMKRWTSNIRFEVFGHYGNKCACCGEFLLIISEEVGINTGKLSVKKQELDFMHG